MGVEGRKGKVFCLFVCTFPQFLCSWEFSFLFCLCPNKKERDALSLWSPVPTAAFMFDTRNFNFRQTQTETVDVCFLYTEHLLCAMFTESLNCVSDLICFHNTGNSRMVFFLWLFSL